MNKDSLILVVDDIADNTLMISETLQAFGYATLTANSGHQTLEIVSKTPDIDLIILDIMMPVMDGLEVCRRLKSDDDTKDIPVIFMSSLTNSENIVEALKVGGVDYISKPFNISETIARVKTHITLKQQHEKLKAQYAEIESLQQVVRKFISKNTWLNIQAESKKDSDIGIVREYEIMTLMFTDIANFTSISEQTDPQLLIDDLTDYMKLLTSIIHKHNGQVDKFLGDGLFAFFVDAVDAKNASCEIQNELDKFNLMLQNLGHKVFLTRIGLATGPILQAILGFDERLEHTVIGDRVNTAARLQSEAPLGGILMDELTFLAIGQPDIAEECAITLKGKSNAELAYLIVPEHIVELATFAY